MENTKSTRRQFIRNSSIIGAGLVSNSIIRNEPGFSEPKSKSGFSYRRLGRTNAMVSDIGTGNPSSAQVLKASLQAGVNFIETAEGYGNGRNEEMIGSVIRSFPREDIFIATKANPNLKLFKSKEDILDRAEASLKRLNTDYIDLYMIHQAQNIIKIKDDFFHRACDQLRKEAKVKFVGLSCHGQSFWQEPRDSLEDIMMSAVEDGRFDVIFFPYNFLEPDAGERILRACKENDIGTMIMKSNPVLVYEKYLNMLKQGRELSRTEQRDYEGIKEKMDKAQSFFESYGLNDLEKIKDGAIQFILTNKNVGTICSRFQNYSDIDKYTSLSGSELAPETNQLLSDFRASLGFLNCRIGCNLCEENCPHHLPVNKILRYTYYFHSRNEEKRAMSKYAAIKGKKADLCTSCDGFCEQACPYGVLSKQLLCSAHENLSMDGTHFA